MRVLADSMLAGHARTAIRVVAVLGASACSAVPCRACGWSHLDLLDLHGLGPEPGLSAAMQGWEVTRARLAPAGWRHRRRVVGHVVRRPVGSRRQRVLPRLGLLDLY